MLMSLIRQTVQEPLQRLPALTAVYLAEASCALTHPGCQLFPAVSRHLMRKPSLDLQVGTLDASYAAPPSGSIAALLCMCTGRSVVELSVTATAQHACAACSLTNRSCLSIWGCMMPGLWV